MTDGDDTVSRNLPEKTRLFKSFLRSCRRDVVVHTIGFGSGHKRAFLQELAAMGNTSNEGCYRYAENNVNSGASGLEDAFAEMFDFLKATVKVQVTIGDKTIEVDGTRVEGISGGIDHLTFDLMLSKKVFENEHHELFCRRESGGTSLFIDACQRTIELQQTSVDSIFKIRAIEEIEICTQEDLDTAQQKLSGINPFRANRKDRMKVMELRSIVQEKFDKYHALFAKIARGLVAAGDKASVSAQLSSLRHETKFTKTRRHRTMDKRAAMNADKMMSMETKLKENHISLDMANFKVPAISGNDNAAPHDELICSLSGDTIHDVMMGSHSDIMVFGMQVHRPEQVIDAPTEIGFLGVCAGVYSNHAFTETTKFACSAQGKGSTSLALGGFAAPSAQKKRTLFDVHPYQADRNKPPLERADTRHGQHPEDIGIFRGPDGQLMNGALPLYLNLQHWTRVEIQLEPLLGFFFTLDPLGFQEAQYMGLFMILGEMLVMRARSMESGHSYFTSDWANWLLNDFSQLCAAVIPRARRYLCRLLKISDAKPDEFDLLDSFIDGPQVEYHPRRLRLPIVDCDLLNQYLSLSVHS
jgi:hypothetical protein